MFASQIVNKNTQKKMITVDQMLTSGQRANAYVNPTTTNPNTGEAIPANVDGLPEWTPSDNGVITVEVSADGKQCYFVPTGIEGAYEVTVTADADLGEGVVTISETFVGIVANPQADNIGAGVQVENV